jgi:hypothetical protein
LVGKEKLLVSRLPQLFSFWAYLDRQDQEYRYKVDNLNNCCCCTVTCLLASASLRGVTRAGSFGRVDTLRGGAGGGPTSNPPSRSSSFGRGEKLPPSLSRPPLIGGGGGGVLVAAAATLPRETERRSRSSGEYVTVLEIGTGIGGSTEVRSRTVPRTRPGGYERNATASGGGSSSRPVSRSNSQGGGATSVSFLVLICLFLNSCPTPCLVLWVHGAICLLTVLYFYVRFRYILFFTVYILYMETICLLCDIREVTELFSLSMQMNCNRSWRWFKLT